MWRSQKGHIKSSFDLTPKKFQIINFRLNAFVVVDVVGHMNHDEMSISLRTRLSFFHLPFHYHVIHPEKFTTHKTSFSASYFLQLLHHRVYFLFLLVLFSVSYFLNNLISFFTSFHLTHRISLFISLSLSLSL